MLVAMLVALCADVLDLTILGNFFEKINFPITYAVICIIGMVCIGICLLTKRYIKDSPDQPTEKPPVKLDKINLKQKFKK